MTVHTSPLLSMKQSDAGGSSTVGSEFGACAPRHPFFNVKHFIQLLLALSMISTLIYIIFFRNFYRWSFAIESNAEFAEFSRIFETDPTQLRPLPTQRTRLACYVAEPLDETGKSTRADSLFEAYVSALNRTWLTECDYTELLVRANVAGSKNRAKIFANFDKIRNPAFWRLVQTVLRLRTSGARWNLVSAPDAFLFPAALMAALNKLDHANPYFIRFDAQKAHPSGTFAMTSAATKLFFERAHLNDSLCAFTSNILPMDLLERCMSRAGVRVLDATDLKLEVVSARDFPVASRPVPKNLVALTSATAHDIVLIYYFANMLEIYR